MIATSLLRGLLIVCAASGLANPLAGATGGGDELDRRIDEAMVSVRRDRPWVQPGPFGAGMPRFDSYAPAPESAVAVRRASSAWRFALSPFLWVPGMSGDLAVDGQSVEVDASIGDIAESVIDNFEFAGMLRFEANHCTWSIIADLIYIGLGNEGNMDLPGAAQIEVEWDLDTLIAQAFAGYRFATLPLGCPTRCFEPRLTLDALAGLRYYHVGMDVDLDPGPSGDGTKDWIDPVVGLRALFHVSPSLGFNLAANVGGFGVGSDLSWQLIGGIDWRLAKCVSLNAGWMILDVDYEDGEFVFDLNMSGPYLALTFRF